MASGTSSAAANKPLPAPTINSLLLTRFPLCAPGEASPIKIITQAIDLFPAPDFSPVLLTPSPIMFRIGNGFDVHRLVPDRKLILCGVEIPYDRGLLGHSDADVALHALCDALLGAAALRDIGYHFPDTDPRYKGADSRLLLRETLSIIREQRNLRPVNVDITIIAQAPKLLPFIPSMIENVAADLNLSHDCVSVKATTTEHLGFTGRGEGIAAQASALLE